MFRKIEKDYPNTFEAKESWWSILISYKIGFKGKNSRNVRPFHIKTQITWKIKQF